jgi:Ca2+-binding RTX toxin-like protein
MWRPSLIFLAVLALAFPAASHAATVELHQQVSLNPRAGNASSFTVIGDDGADDLLLTRVGDILDVVDPTRPVTVLAGSEVTRTRCHAIDEHHLRCAYTLSAHVSVDGRGGDDRLTSFGPTRGSVSGGAGDDVIRTGDGDEQLDGGPGDDVLDAGAGGDMLTGGPGHDEQHGGPGRDVFSMHEALGDGETLYGGSGQNEVRVSDPGQPLRVDLATGRVTSPRGVTQLIGFQDASVDAQAPLVLGDDGPNELLVGTGGRVEGRGGDDVLQTSGTGAVALGGDGADLLLGEQGAILDGGPGNDRLRAGDGRLGGMRCGAGLDVIEGLGDPIRPADCEGAHTWVGFVGRAAPRGRAIAVALDAFDGAVESNPNCGVRVQALRLDGRPVTATLRARRHGLTTLRLPLKVAKAPKVVRFRVRFASSCPRGGRPWAYEPRGNAVWPAVTLTR